MYIKVLLQDNYYYSNFWEGRDGAGLLHIYAL